MRRLEERNMTTLDVENIITGGWVNRVEPVSGGRFHGCWRYTLTTREMCATIQFSSPSLMVAVTAWRL